MNATLTINVDFDPDVADAEDMGNMLDSILTEALEDPEIVEGLGDPQFHGFDVQPEPGAVAEYREDTKTQDARYAFDLITGASYYGCGFRQVLIEDAEARKAAFVLISRLRHHGAKGLK